MNKYKRILLKITGEYFGGDAEKGLHFDSISKLASFLKNIDVEIAIVVGAGNIFRGRSGIDGSDRVSNDQIGMMATAVNALTLGSELDRIGRPTRVMTAFDVEGITERYVQKKAMSYLDEKKIVILGGGTGNPYCTTDYAAALRALELKCDVILKASNVDGVYSEDPKINPQATKFDEISFNDVIDKKLKIMDITAFTVCQDNNMPIVVFNINDLENITKLLNGEKVGTLIS